MIDLFYENTFKARLKANIEEKNHYLKFLGENGINYDEIYPLYSKCAERLKNYMCDTSKILEERIERGENILFEGAQGSLLDIDHGTYPYVTSSNTVAGAACVGSGTGPTSIHRVIGVSKAYTTRVGEGPFPTETKDEIGERLRAKGNEFGATTGRPRRCGWWDGVLARYAARISGISGLALTKIDILSGIGNIKLCTKYLLDDKSLTEGVPSNPEEWEASRVYYEEMEGWKEELSSVKDYEFLPKATKKYIKRIEDIVGKEIFLISVGDKREETIIIKNPFIFES